MPWPRKRRLPSLDVLDHRALERGRPREHARHRFGERRQSRRHRRGFRPGYGPQHQRADSDRDRRRDRARRGKHAAAPGRRGDRPQRQAAGSPTGSAYNPQTHGEATAFVQVGTPGTVTLEVTRAHGTSGSFQLREYLPGDINGDGQVTFADLAQFPKYFRSQTGDPLYNLAADANLNGQVGQEDARALVRNLDPGVPKTPLQINLFLAPQEDVKGHVPSTSGGHTYYQTVTIEGHTTPGSIVFFDSSLGDYTFNEGAAATNAKGDFSVTAKNTQGINNNDFLVISPFGQQKVQDYPVYYFPAVYSRDIKANPAKAAGSGTRAAAATSGAAKGSGARSHFEVLPAGTP